MYGIATSSIGLEGPYFTSDIPYGSDSCASMRIVNNSSASDTIRGMTWAHNSNGIFTWDSVSLPYVLAAHDTTNWTYCFHAPDNTTENIDTIVLTIGSQSNTVSRLIEAASASPSDNALTLSGPYFPQLVPEGADTCISSSSGTGGYPCRLINTTSSPDTIVSLDLAPEPNNPSGIFTWDSVALPYILGAHDTATWTFCFHAPDNTNTYADTITVHYEDASGQHWFDSRFLVAHATDTTPPDGELRAVGPYFPGNVPMGGDTCMSHGSVWPLVLINSGSNVDTVKSFSWAHDPGSIFSLETSGTTFPFTIPAGDTMFWTACFHAPSDTDIHWDTINILYSDAYNNDRHVTRVVYAKAVDTTIKTCYGMYAAAAAVTNYGDTSYIHLFIHNYLDSSTSLTAIHISGTDDGAFRVDSSGFPNPIASNTYDSVWLMFIPNRTTGSTEYSATATLSFTTNDTAHCHSSSVSLVGYMPQSCSDTETVAFDTTGSSDVSLSGDSGHYYAHRVDFVNNSSSTVIVTAVRWLNSSSHFLVAQVVPALPDTLVPGGRMAVIVHFYGDTSGTTYYDTLALTVSGGFAAPFGKNSALSSNGAYYVNFTGHSNSAPATVSQPITPNAPTLLLFPNPSSGIVNMELEGATNTTFKLIDVLGNIIASHRGTNVWQWNADALGLLKDGTYFIRASDGNGVTTKRLVLER